MIEILRSGNPFNGCHERSATQLCDYKRIALRVRLGASHGQHHDGGDEDFKNYSVHSFNHLGSVVIWSSLGLGDNTVSCSNVRAAQQTLEWELARHLPLDSPYRSSDVHNPAYVQEFSCRITPSNDLVLYPNAGYNQTLCAFIEDTFRSISGFEFVLIGIPRNWSSRGPRSWGST